MLLLSHNELESNYATHEHYNTITKAKNLTSIMDWTGRKDLKSDRKGVSGEVKKYLEGEACTCTSPTSTLLPCDNIVSVSNVHYLSSIHNFT
jgi:hypothetical protein